MKWLTEHLITFQEWRRDRAIKLLDEIDYKWRLKWEHTPRRQRWYLRKRTTLIRLIDRLDSRLEGLS